MRPEKCMKGRLQSVQRSTTAAPHAGARGEGRNPHLAAHASRSRRRRRLSYYGKEKGRDLAPEGANAASDAVRSVVSYTSRSVPPQEGFSGGGSDADYSQVSYPRCEAQEHGVDL
jgi:hypothetical protein